MALFLTFSIVLTLAAFLTIVRTSDKPFPPYDNNEPENLDEIILNSEDFLEDEDDFTSSGISSNRLNFANV